MLDSRKSSRLFATEADQDPDFARETSVLPRAGESQESLKTALSSEHWIILSGGKGSGKTSFLFLGLRDLPRQMLGVYCPFETVDSKFEIKSAQDKDDFLCKHFYAGLVARLDKTIKDTLPGKANESNHFLQGMIDALIPVEVEKTRKVKKDRGFLARIGIRREPIEVGVSLGRSIEDEIIERRKIPARPDYEKFRQTLEDLISFLGFRAVVFFVDELNEIRLSPSEVATLFEHLYTAYKTHKATICFKMAITDTVEQDVPDSIVAGNYFEPKNLKSFLIYPKEYEEFVREILQARMKVLGLQGKLKDIFSESALQNLIMASMGNPRDFFLASRQAWESQAERIDNTLALEKIKQVGGQREASILQEGGALKKTYENLVETLKERSLSKAGDVNSPTGVSYFLIADESTLSKETRDSLARLEQEKILYSTRSYKALRRRGQKAEMMVISYPICALKSIRYLDVVRTMEQTGQTQNQVISQHRAQIRLPPT